MIRDILIFIGMVIEGALIAVAWVLTAALMLIFAPFVLGIAFLTRRNAESLQHGCKEMAIDD